MNKVKNSILFLIVGLLVFSFPQIGQAQKKNKNSLLWKVEGKGLKTSYIMGTFHVLPQKDFNLKNKVKKAFDQAEQIVLELDMDSPDMQKEMMSHIMMSGNKNLKDYMSEEEYELLDKKLREFSGMGLAAYGKMKPIALTSMITMSLMGEQPASFELTFVQMAREQKKEIHGLETIAEQMEVFEKTPYEDQIDEIVEMIRTEEGTNAYFSKLIESYNAENLTEIMKYMDEYTDDAEQQAILLDDRNIKWIPKIEAFASEKSTFFGVGAGHLPGKNGLIKLLKKAGYKVTPVTD